MKSSGGDRFVAVQIVAGAIAFRLLSAFIGFFCNILFPLDRPLQFSVFPTPSPFWDTLARYDTGYFQDIAWNGYAPAPGGRSNIAYFPVYPLLIRWIGELFGHHHATYYITGVGIAWVSYVLAMAALYYLARLDRPQEPSVRAVVLMTIFPFSFFYGVAYSEATFVLFTILAFYLFRTKRWILGGVCGGIATATRVPGILMLAPLAWIAWKSTGREGQDRREGWGGRERVRAAIGLALAASGFLAYCGYIYAVTGNPLEWAATLQRWGYFPGGSPWMAPVTLVRKLATHPYAFLAGEAMAPYDTLYGVTGILFALMTPFVWIRFGAAYGLFMLLNLYLPFSSGVFEGVGRYCSVLFPAFIWLASLQSRALGTALIVVFALFYTLGLALFTTIHPLF